MSSGMYLLKKCCFWRISDSLFTFASFSSQIKGKRQRCQISFQKLSQHQKLQFLKCHLQVRRMFVKKQFTVQLNQVHEIKAKWSIKITVDYMYMPIMVIIVHPMLNQGFQFLRMPWRTIKMPILYTCLRNHDIYAQKNH